MVRSMLLVVVLVVGCAADSEHAPSEQDGGPACSCDSPIDVDVSATNCVPQADGSCLDAGTHHWSGPLDTFLLELCPEPAEISCAANVYTSICRGRPSQFTIVTRPDGTCGVEL